MDERYLEGRDRASIDFASSHKAIGSGSQSNNVNSEKKEHKEVRERYAEDKDRVFFLVLCGTRQRILTCIM